MGALDEPRRPQTIELEVAVKQRLDEQRFREAVATAAGRHPMARARRLPARPLDGNYSWAIDGALPRDPVEVRATAEPAALDHARTTFSSRHIDVETGPPFRVLLVREEHGDRVLLSVNHSAFDGIGALRLLQSISRCYAGEVDPRPDLDALEARALLDERGPPVRRGATAPALPPAHFRPPARLASTSSQTADGFGILHLDLDASAAASSGDATVNDVLLAALHLTIAEWNQSRGVPCARVTVMMPVNQRPAVWRGEMLANLVLPGRVESTPAERVRTNDLLATVVAQTRRIKTNGVGETSDPVPRRTPVMLRRLLPHLIDAVADRMADTSVLSNLGRIEEPPWFGGVGRGLWFSPPPRRPVILTVGAATAEGRLGISLRWCNGAFSAPAAQEFADTLVTSLALLSSGST